MSWSARFFGRVPLSIASVHLLLWAMAWTCAAENPPMLLPHQGYMESLGCEDPYPPEALGGPLSIAVFATVLSIPLVFPMGCVLWSTAKPAVLALAIANSLLWGVGLSGVGRWMRNAVYRLRQGPDVQRWRPRRM
jgi:hypothetical protein